MQAKQNIEISLIRPACVELPDILPGITVLRLPHILEIRVIIVFALLTIAPFMLTIALLISITHCTMI